MHLRYYDILNDNLLQIQCWVGLWKNSKTVNIWRSYRQESRLSQALCALNTSVQNDTRVHVLCRQCFLPTRPVDRGARYTLPAFTGRVSGPCSRVVCSGPKRCNVFATCNAVAIRPEAKPPNRKKSPLSNRPVAHFHGKRERERVVMGPTTTITMSHRRSIQST